MLKRKSRWDIQIPAENLKLHALLCTLDMSGPVYRCRTSVPVRIPPIIEMRTVVVSSASWNPACVPA